MLIELFQILVCGLLVAIVAHWSRMQVKVIRLQAQGVVFSSKFSVILDTIRIVRLYYSNGEKSSSFQDVLLSFVERQFLENGTKE